MKGQLRPRSSPCPNTTMESAPRNAASRQLRVAASFNYGQVRRNPRQAPTASFPAQPPPARTRTPKAAAASRAAPRWRAIDAPSIFPSSNKCRRDRFLYQHARSRDPTRGAASPDRPQGHPAYLRSSRRGRHPHYAEGGDAYSLRTCWRTVCEDAMLGRLRLHGLRHTAASQAVMAGENLPLEPQAWSRSW